MKRLGYLRLSVNLWFQRLMPYPVQRLDIDSDYDLGRAFGVFTHLRPHLDLATFTKQVRAQRAEGYQIAVVEREAEIAAGFRAATFLAWGKVLYIDDLITHPEKKRLELGTALLDWLIAEAHRQQCDAMHLDSGFARHDAHRLYLNKGFKISSHHLSRPV